MRSGGGYTGVVPPDPIPNSVVKYSRADDSSSSAKVGRRHQSAFFVFATEIFFDFQKPGVFAIISIWLLKL